MYANAEQRNRERVKVLADQLYRERYHYLLRIARRNGAGDDADDAVNDAFAAFIDKFDPASGSPPLGWITLTLQRRCWAINRSRRLERRAGHWSTPNQASRASRSQAFRPQRPVPRRGPSGPSTCSRHASGWRS